MLLDSVLSAFHDFQFEGSVSNKTTHTPVSPYSSRTQECRISFVWRHRHLVFIEERVYHYDSLIIYDFLEQNHSVINQNIYLSNFIIISQCNLVF